ncbi:hypothetical protein BDN72DRAFT_897607 [Pluteus cervinus]|uniref:Uncharacterized protein n=1 Tax=Pluteus cervinus TaxID=181527 RepID=A0ACD3AU44_9AGAR|nr:hypothetical protein BDN72DRAFT_897607 [Pluteus cervinus]
MADVGQKDLFPFEDVEDDEVQDLDRIKYVSTSDDDVLLPFGGIGDEEVQDLRRLEHNPPSEVLQELPFAQRRNLAGLTNGSKTKAAMNDFTYDFGIYTPEANTTYNFVPAYLMITHRRENIHLKEDIPFITRLPLDVLIEVLKYVHPLDLYNISIADPSLKSIVTPLWKDVWAEIPDKPSTVSYVQWAGLWFGPAICEGCNKRVGQPDFTANKRYCTKCLHARVEFIYDAGIGDTSTWLSCLPVASRTNGYHISGYHNIGSGWRFIHQVKQLKLRLAAFDNDIAKGVPGASKAKDEYVQSMTASAKLQSAHADRCEKYAAKMIDKVKKKLVHREGFTLDEIGGLYSQLDLDWQKDLTLTMSRRYLNRTWSTRIIPTAHDCKRVYHQVQREQTIVRRNHMIEVVYEIFQRKQVKPEEWYKLPPPNAFSKMKRCEEYAQDVEKGEPQMEECVELVEGMEGEVMAWFDERKADFCADFLHKKSLVEDTYSGIQAPKPTLDRPVDEMINLAVSVFSCHACDSTWYRYGDKPYTRAGIRAFGWDAISKHFCCRGRGDSSHIAYTLDTTCWMLIRMLLEKVGLDYQTTTGEDMNKLGHRFVCQLCSRTLLGYRRMRGRPVFDWRGFVRHMTNGEFHFGYGDELNPNSWKVLAPEAVWYVQPRETRYPERGDPSWSCNHCATHYNALVPYKSVLSHLKDHHDIKEVTIGVDVIHIPHTYHTVSIPVVIPIAPHNLRCLICSEDKSTRTWFMEKTMVQHLRDKHNIFGDVQENQHWKAVDMFLP